MNAEQVVAEYDALLQDLDARGATADWRARRRLVNICLRSLILERDYRELASRGSGTVNRQDDELIGRAVKLRRQIYRRRKEMQQRGER